MTQKPVVISSDITIEECAVLMQNKHVGSLIIMESKNIIGIITEQDIVRKVVARKEDPKKTRVKNIMATELMTIGPNADIYDALVIMRDNNIRHLPIVYSGNLVGYLTIKDILKIEPQLFEIIVEKFQLREENRKPI